MRCAPFLLALALLLAAPCAWAREAGPRTLAVPGFPAAFYVPPSDPHVRTVVIYLHARGADPEEDCRAWAKIVRPYAWTLCPAGQGTTASGGRTWNNDAAFARRVTEAALAALAAGHPGRVAARGNVLAGFSEGAFVLQQLGIHDPGRWSRWLVLAASDRYWDASASACLGAERPLLRRVALVTGDQDSVVEDTRRVATLLEDAKVPVRTRIVPGLGHELALARMRALYRKPLDWLLGAPPRRLTARGTRSTRA